MFEKTGRCYTQMGENVANTSPIHTALAVFVPAPSEPRHAKQQCYLAPDYSRQEKASLMFVAYALGEDEPHLDPCRRRVEGSLWQSHLGYSQNGQKMRRYAVRVLDEAGLRWDPYLHREQPAVKQGRGKALVMTCSASERAFVATREP